jgi:integrase
VKPRKPYPEFPLYAHNAGYWAKKIRGKFHYFGPWEDPDGALSNYEKQKDALHAGKSGQPDLDQVTLKDLANAILNQKQSLVDSNELAPRTWADYKFTTDLLIKHFSKRQLLVALTPDDFATLRKKLAARWGPVRVGNTIQYIRSIFKFGYESGMIDKPMRFGPTFKRPSKKVLRLHKAQQGLKLFAADEINSILELASTEMKAMILLGINCGFGNADCARLPISAVDLNSGWIDYPRPKTGIHRRCPLWPETIQALQDTLGERNEPKDETAKGLLFITRYKRAWEDPASITHEMGKLLKSIGVNSHRNFYTLRHTFRTVADSSKDQPACDLIMGHSRNDMASIYRETISDERLRAVVDCVHSWLFGKERKGGAK